MLDAEEPGPPWRGRRGPAFWDRLATELGIAPNLFEHIVNMAKRKGASPWDDILLVRRRDADHCSETRNRRNRGGAKSRPPATIARYAGRSATLHRAMMHHDRYCHGGHMRTRREPIMSQRNMIYIVGAIIIVIVIAYFLRS